MELNGRLMAIAEKISICGRLVDIGTDHAYIPIYAVKNGICSFAVASDVRKGPVETAKRNIANNGLEEKIETCLGNGLEAIGIDSRDTVVIAGMGGILIARILQASSDKAACAGMLVLQPMNAADALRRWLYQNGFEITDEVLAADSGKVYNIISSRYTGAKSIRDEFGIYMGYELLRDHSSDPLMKRYLVKKLEQVEKVIKGRESSEKRKEGLEEYRGLRDGILSYLDQCIQIK